MATSAALSMTRPQRKIVGTVISAGKMAKTVTVRISRQKWHPFLRKNFTEYMKILVHDPNSSLLEGDVIALAPWKSTRNVKHTVEEILSPFGKPVDQRPPVPSLLERNTRYLEEKIQKLEKKAMGHPGLKETQLHLELKKLGYLEEELAKMRTLERQLRTSVLRLLTNQCESSRSRNTEIAMEIPAVVLDAARARLTDILAQPHRQAVLHVVPLDAQINLAPLDASEIGLQVRQLKAVRSSKSKIQQDLLRLQLERASAGADKFESLIERWKRAVETWKARSGATQPRVQ